MTIKEYHISLTTVNLLNRIDYVVFINKKTP